MQDDTGGMACKRLDLMRYWTLLKEGGFDPGVVYTDMLRRAEGLGDQDEDQMNHSTVGWSDAEADEKVSGLSFFIAI